MITTISGERIPESLISFDEQTYHFFRGINDVTNDITRADKLRLVPGFDVEKENRRLSAERGSGSAYGRDALSESTLGPLLTNLVTDPLGAPIDSLGNKANQIFGSAGIWKLLIFAAVLFAAWVYVEGGWFKRR